MIPIIFTWTDDGVMKPLDRFVKQADKQFVVGETYRMEVIEERSHASHAHYFSACAEAWKNLPPDKAAEYPSVEHLRKRALIKCGYFHDSSVVCETHLQATRVAAFVKPLDDFGVVLVKQNVVRMYRAKSQSYSEMSKEEFQASKNAVLELLADLIGVKPSELKQQGERPPA